MKLIVCSLCRDARALRPAHRAACACGQSWGMYSEDGVKAEYGGLAIPVEICSESLALAMRRRRKDDHYPWGVLAYLVEADCPTFRKGDS